MNGADHPRRTAELTGHGQAEQTLLDGFNSGRLAHAWLLSGRKGVGKATLAYRFARFLLARCGPHSSMAAAQSLCVDRLDPVFKRIAAGAHADLKAIERQFDEKKGRYRGQIVVDDVRSIGSFLSLTSAEGGWRVVVIDSADEMNRNAANAVLKVLEEPPAGAVLLLVSHNPGRLLPTIRSRCRQLALSDLPEDAVAALLGDRHPELSAADALALAGLTEGSIGRALDMEAEGGLALYRELLQLLETLPRLDIAALHALAAKLGRVGAEGAYETFAELLRGWLGRLIAGVARGSGQWNEAERNLNGRLATAAPLASWLEVWDKINHLLARTDAVNMDRRQMMITVFLALEKAARP